MNHIRHIHNPAEEAHAHKAPFWVRYYDIVTNLITLGRTRKVHEGTLSLAGLQPDDAVLDVGCGTGRLLLEAEKVIGAGGTAAGLDVEPEMIRQARSNAARSGSRITFDVASITEIPYADESFDVVFSTLMYHHLSDEQRPRGLREAARVLKPGGRLVLVDLNAARRSILTSLPGHSQVARDDYVKNEVVEQMRTAGLTVEKTGAHPAKQLSYAIGRKR